MSATAMLLQPRLPKGSHTLAALEVVPGVPGQRTGKGASAAAIAPLPGTVPTATGGSLGRTVAGHRSPSDPGSPGSGDTVDGGNTASAGGSAAAGAGGKTAGAGAAARGPAPSPPSAEFSPQALPAARLLCFVPATAECAAAAFLLPLMPPGFAARSRPRSTMAQAAPATPWSGAAFATTSGDMTSLQIA
jgi:hypothetical protein